MSLGKKERELQQEAAEFILSQTHKIERLRSQLKILRGICELLRADKIKLQDRIEAQQRVIDELLEIHTRGGWA